MRSQYAALEALTAWIAFDPSHTIGKLKGKKKSEYKIKGNFYIRKEEKSKIKKHFKKQRREKEKIEYFKK